jgi:hypothetical protein
MAAVAAEAAKKARLSMFSSRYLLIQLLGAGASGFSNRAKLSIARP